MNTAEYTDKIFSYLLQQNIMDNVVKQVSARVILVAIVLAAMLYFITLAYNYINAALESIKDKGKPFEVDLPELFRTMILVGCIIVYIPFMEVIVGMGEFFNRLTAAKGTQSELMEGYANEYLKSSRLYSVDISTQALQELVNDPKASPEAQEYALAKIEENAKKMAGEIGIEPNEDVDKGSWFNWKILNPISMPFLIVKGLCYTLTQLIKVLITGLATAILKILICLGPLAIAFSILPLFRKGVEMWFSTIITTLFVFTTLNILEHIQMAGLAYFKKEGIFAVASEGPYAMMTFELVNLILYTMAFWLTGKVVGKGDAGRVLSKTIGIAALAAGAAVTGGASAVAGGATSAGSAVQAGANVIGGDGE